MSAEKEEELKKHLSWCVDEIVLGLKSKKPNSKQFGECAKILKVLTSSKAPVVKKRQLMRQTFGDYRKKIDAEERKWEQELLKITKLQGFNSKARPTGTKYRLSTSKSLHRTALIKLTALKLTTADHQFYLFNFQLNES